MPSDLLQQAREVFAHDRFATDLTGITLHAAALKAAGRSGTATCHLTVQPVHRNAAGIVMGGVLFTLADFAFAVASNLPHVAAGESLCWCSLNSTIHYLTTGSDNQLRATAHCIRQGRSTCLYSIHIHDGKGVLLATVETTGMKTTFHPNKQ